MKNAIFLFLLILSAGCAELADTHSASESEFSGAQALSASSAADTTPAAIGAGAKGKKIVPPQNAPTTPGAVAQSHMDMAKTNPKLGSNFGMPRESRKNLSRAGHAVPDCKGKSGECATDADCKEGTSCLCRPSGGPSKCVPSDCRTDADCGEGNQCIEALMRVSDDLTCNSVAISFRCTSDADECFPGPNACGQAPDAGCLYGTDTQRFVCAEHCKLNPRMGVSAVR